MLQAALLIWSISETSTWFCCSSKHMEKQICKHRKIYKYFPERKSEPEGFTEGTQKQIYHMAELQRALTVKNLVFSKITSASYSWCNLFFLVSGEMLLFLAAANYHVFCGHYGPSMWNRP